MSNPPPIDWMRTAGSLLLVLALLGGMLWLLKRVKAMQEKNNGHRQMELIETLSVGVRQKIALVRVGTRQVLVGMTPGQFTALASWDAAPAGTRASAIAPAAAPLEPLP
ncbi:MAG: flagellar biosynthetic protein FliO [Betaproteobacteria bacterium]|nr:flagellar biosynthetic protein FliO [Betaproteobacteria bacterium]